MGTGYRTALKGLVNEEKGDFKKHKGEKSEAKPKVGSPICSAERKTAGLRKVVLRIKQSLDYISSSFIKSSFIHSFIQHTVRDHMPWEGTSPRHGDTD